jgi:hypothetical protein
MLTSSDVFTFGQPPPPDYPTECLLNFKEYQGKIAMLLSHFFEDIVTIQEKVEALEAISGQLLKDIGRNDGLPEQLKKTIVSKVDALISTFNDGVIHERSTMIRRESAIHSSSIPYDLNIEYLQQYIRDRLTPLMSRIYKAYYRAPSGPNDSKLVALLQKIGKLDEFFANLSEGNILSKINFHYIELITFLFSNNSKADLVRQIPNLVCLDMRHIVENVVEGGGREWMKSEVTTRSTFTTKENTIDNVNTLLTQHPKPFMLNLDVIFKLKLLRDKIDMKHELCYHIEKAL